MPRGEEISEAVFCDRHRKDLPPEPFSLQGFEFAWSRPWPLGCINWIIN